MTTKLVMRDETRKDFCRQLANLLKSFGADMFPLHSDEIVVTTDKDRFTINIDDNGVGIVSRTVDVVKPCVQVTDDDFPDVRK